MTNASSGDSSHPMDFLLDEELNLPSAGDIRSGWVVAQRSNEILVDIGAKSEGVIGSHEVSSLDSEALEVLSEGNEVLVYVVNPEDNSGNIILSYLKAKEEKDWVRAVNLMENQEVCDCIVVGFNRGGVLVDVGQVRGFVPNSQLRRERRVQRGDQPDKQRVLQAMIGETLNAKIIEVNRERNRLILSEIAASKEIREAKKAELIEEMEVGDVFDGQVVNLANFGAFVDIGGIEGLVHLSELSWKRVTKPSDVLQVGDEVRVSVLKIDHDRQRIALSIKRLEADPWTLIDDTYEVGQLVEATITRLTKFGAFARLNDDYQLEGLIHISEMAEERVEHPREVVNVDENVMVRIIRVDAEQRQLGLSLKQVSSEKF
ncbi:MAG: S1 RNA-binding domain-containing protein, partial [Candidatus Promineifilaceae bacterium]|nr:S1 RNA-binding domain-containing protein [Candidatus Promineifilaceae bacterium]